MQHLLRGVQTLLCGGQPFRQDYLHGIGPVGNQKVQFLTLSRGKRLKHVGSGILPARGPADAHTYPHIVRGAQRLGQILEAVMAGGAAAALSFTVPNGKSSSSWTTMISVAGTE